MGPYCPVGGTIPVGQGGEDRAEANQPPLGAPASFIEFFSGSLIPNELLEPLPAHPEWSDDFRRFKAREKRKKKR